MFEHVKSGDTITRNMAGIVMKLKVTGVEDGIITAGLGWLNSISVNLMFEAKTGWEYDPDLKWGTEFGRTGSHLVAE